MRNALAGIAALLAVLFLIIGCGRPADGPTSVSGASPAATPVVTENAPSTAPMHDPPYRFSAESITIAGGPLAIADGVAYYYTRDEIAAADLATGRVRWQTLLPGAIGLNDEMQDNRPMPGVVVTADGQTLLVAAYPVIIQGTGTRADKTRTAVVAVDTAGKIKWVRTVEWVLMPKVIGSVRGEQGAVVALDIDGGTVALDASDGAVRWSRKDVVPAAVEDAALVGLRRSGDGEHATVVGLAADGSQLWPVKNALSLENSYMVVLAGRGRAVVTGPDLTTVVDTASQRALSKFPGNLHCVYDDKDTAVCSTGRELDGAAQLVIAIDARSGRKLWSLPDEKDQRVAIEVMSAYHGAVYGAAENGQVVLDARSGVDVISDADVVPTQVIPGYGLFTDFTGYSDVGRETLVYRSTG